MKVNWPVGLALVAGVVLGAVSSAALVARHYNRMLESFYLMSVAEQAAIARQIKTGAGERLAEQIATALPDYALVIESKFGRSEGRISALRSVRDFYRATGAEIPDEISSLLEALPPEPGGRPGGAGPEPRKELEDAL